MDDTMLRHGLFMSLISWSIIPLKLRKMKCCCIYPWFNDDHSLECASGKSARWRWLVFFLCAGKSGFWPTFIGLCMYMAEYIHSPFTFRCLLYIFVTLFATVWKCFCSFYKDTFPPAVRIKFIIREIFPRRLKRIEKAHWTQYISDATLLTNCYHDKTTLLIYPNKISLVHSDKITLIKVRFYWTKICYKGSKMLSHRRKPVLGQCNRCLSM